MVICCFISELKVFEWKCAAFEEPAEATEQSQVEINFVGGPDQMTFSNKTNMLCLKHVR